MMCKLSPATSFKHYHLRYTLSFSCFPLSFQFLVYVASVYLVNLPHNHYFQFFLTSASFNLCFNRKSLCNAAMVPKCQLQLTLFCANYGMCIIIALARRNKCHLCHDIIIRKFISGICSSDSKVDYILVKIKLIPCIYRSFEFKLIRSPGTYWVHIYISY